MCKKQTSESHSSTTSAILSLDAGFRMGGFLPALDLWDVVLDVLRSTQGDANSNVADSRETGARPTIRPKPKQTKTTRNISKWLLKEGRSPTMRQRKSLFKTSVIPWARIGNENGTQRTLSRCKSQLYMFEHSEAAIKMIIKGRSQTLRHVARTHWVALDWVVRINLDPKIQIKYVDSDNQLEYMFTNGSFTRDEWNNLLHLVSIVICRHFLAASTVFPTESRVLWCRKWLKESLSNDSPTVKTKSRSTKFVFASKPVFCETSLKTQIERTGKVSSNLGKPLRCSTDDSPSLRCQERSKGNTCKVGSEHSGQDVNPSSSAKLVRRTIISFFV